MRTLITITIVIFLFSFTTLSGQTKTRGYQLFFGKNTFQTSTTISKSAYDTTSFREFSYLFENQFQIIKIPRRIDTVLERNVSDPSDMKIKIDTVDEISVNKIVDTISKAELADIANSEIQIYDRMNKLKFDEAQFETIQPNGKTSYTIDLQKPKIKEGKYAFKSLLSLKEGGYLILRTVWFYDSKQNKQEIECNIAWMIE